MHVQVEAYCKRKGKPPSMNRKRQIFADILVWYATSASKSVRLLLLIALLAMPCA